LQPGSGLDDPVALRATKHIQGLPQGCRVERSRAPADASTTADHATVWVQHDRLAKIGTGGKVCLCSVAGTHLIADVNDYFPA